MTFLGTISSKTFDSHAEDAVYHQIYSVNFVTGKEIPQKFCSQEEVSDVPPSKNRKGRACDRARKTALEEALRCYTNSEEPLLLTIILGKMTQILSETSCDSLASIFREAKDLLVSEYSELVVVSGSNRKETLVKFRDMANRILREFRQEVKAVSEKGERDLENTPQKIPPLRKISQ